MIKQIIKVILTFGMLFYTALSFSNESILGLGDGTLPLRLSGVATSIRQPSVSLDAEVYLKSVKVIPGRPAFSCENQLRQPTYLDAVGSIMIGFQKYIIEGVCVYRPGSELNIVARNDEGNAIISGQFRAGNLETIRLTGALQTKLMGGLQSYRLDVIYRNRSIVRE